MMKITYNIDRIKDKNIDFVHMNFKLETQFSFLNATETSFIYFVILKPPILDSHLLAQIPPSFSRMSSSLCNGLNYECLF